MFLARKPLKIIACQLLFYVTFSGAAWSYSSDVLTQPDVKEHIRTYYPKHLSRLRQAVKPRLIRYIDSRNYKRYGRLAVEGILFTYKNPRAKQVYLATDIDKFNRRSMIRNERGVWYTILIPEEYREKKYRKKLRYKFWVDGLFQHDATHQNYEDDMANGVISFFYLNDESIRPEQGALQIQNAASYGKKVVFRIYAPNARNVSLLASFNGWNTELDPMKKTAEGYFVIEKVLAPGEYIYLYKIDGTTTVDKHNLTLKYHPVYGRTSYLKISQ